MTSAPTWTVEVRGWLSREGALSVAEAIANSPGLPASIAVVVVPGESSNLDRDVTVVRSGRAAVEPGG